MGLSGAGEPYSAALVVEGAEAERHAGGFLDQPGEGHVGRRGYPPAFRRKVLDLVAAGRPVIEVAGDLGISCQTIYAWRRQDRIDQGLDFVETVAEPTKRTQSDVIERLHRGDITAADAIAELEGQA